MNMSELFSQPILNVLTFFYLLNTIDVLLVVFGIYGIFWLILKNKLEPKKIQKQPISRKQKKTEFWHFLLNLIVFPLFAVPAIWSMFQLNFFNILAVHTLTDLFFAIIQFLFILFAHDTYFYWTHRFMHYPKVFQFIHRVHHTSPNPNPFTSYSFDIFEAFLNVLFLPLCIFVIALLFGAGYSISIICFIAFYTLFNVYFHSGYELMPAWWIINPFTKWIITSTHHNIHHAKNNGNFGFYFTFWDEFCKTTSRDYKNTFSSLVK